MAKEKSLKAALERMKGGVDHKKEHQKKLRKQAEKKQRQNVQASAVDENDAHTDGGVELSGDVNVEPLAEMSLSQARAAAAGGAEPDAEGWETDGSEEDEDDAAAKEEGGVELGTFEDESESDSDEEQSFYTAPSKSPRKKLAPTDQDDDDEDNDEDDAEEDDEDIALSDIESLASDEKGDLIPHQRLTINNTAALTRSLKAFALPSTLPFSATQSTTTAAPVEIPDIDDDLARELAFYKQSLDAVKTARIALKKEGVAFTRPTDYFAEMVKSEEQMGKVRQKVVDEVARKKASGDARRQRDLKKFGKAVQVAKLQERDKANTQTLERIAVLKRSECNRFVVVICYCYVLTPCPRTSRRRAHNQGRRHVRRRTRRCRACGQSTARQGRAW